MGKIILITGGARSGKSLYAQHLAEKLGQKRLYIATCPVIDEELKARIKAHQKERENRGWHTIEETVLLKSALEAGRNFDIVLVDCLTLWVNNLMHQSLGTENELTENQISLYCTQVASMARNLTCTTIFVTNEVGMGIVPENHLSRKYRDLLGRCNQVMAQAAQEVIFMVSGIPLKLKG